MIIILDIGTKDGNKYIFNVWSVVEYEDGTFGKDVREEATDNFQEMVDYLKSCPDKTERFG